MARLTLSLSGPWTGGLRRLLLGRVSSVVSGVAVANVLRIFSSLVLTRLLDSSSYGVVGIVTSVAYMLSMLTDTGLVPFVIRHERGGEPIFLDEVWTIRLVRGALLTAVMLVLAVPIAAFLGKRDLSAVIMVWSFSFLLDGLASLAMATGVREQRLWRLSVLDMLTNVASIGISITAALALRSYWAMIAGMLGSQMLRTVLSYRLFPASARSLRVSIARSREIWAFSRNIALSSAISLFIVQMDKVLLARMMPLETFGLYAIATTLAIAPEAITVPYGYRILYPAYVKAVREGDGALRTIFYDVRRHLSLAYAFGVGGLIGGAPLVVRVLYDQRYLGVVLFLRIVAVRVLLRMSNLAAYQASVAMGDTRSGLIANFARGGWLLVGGAAALARGDPLLLIAVVATDEVPAMFWYWQVLRRARILQLRQELLYAVAAAAGLVVGFAVVLAAHPLFP